MEKKILIILLFALISNNLVSSQEEIIFSKESGFYNTEFLLSLSTSSESLPIFYTVSSCTFGIYLIHNHLLFNDFLWRNILKTSDFIRSYYFTLYALGTIILLYIICLLIDFLRKQYIEKPVINYLHINKICDSLDLWLKQE